MLRNLSVTFDHIDRTFQLANFRSFFFSFYVFPVNAKSDADIQTAFPIIRECCFLVTNKNSVCLTISHNALFVYSHTYSVDDSS